MIFPWSSWKTMRNSASVGDSHGFQGIFDTAVITGPRQWLHRSRRRTPWAGALAGTLMGKGLSNLESQKERVPWKTRQNPNGPNKRPLKTDENHHVPSIIPVKACKSHLKLYVGDFNPLKPLWNSHFTSRFPFKKPRLSTDPGHFSMRMISAMLPSARRVPLAK